MNVLDLDAYVGRSRAVRVDDLAWDEVARHLPTILSIEALDHG